MFDIYLLAASASYRYTYQGDDVGAVSDALWNNGEACGKIVNIRCIGATNLAPQPCNISSTSALQLQSSIIVRHEDAEPSIFQNMFFLLLPIPKLGESGLLMKCKLRFNLVLKINTFVYKNILRSTKYADKVIH